MTQMQNIFEIQFYVYIILLVKNNNYLIYILKIINIHR